MSPDTTSTRRGFALHLACAGWILCVVLVHALRPAPDADTPEGWFRLGQLETTSTFAVRDRATLVGHEDARLREFAFTNTFTRHLPGHDFERDLERLADPVERLRAQLWLTCRTTTPRRLTLADLDRWFASPPP